MNIVQVVMSTLRRLVKLVRLFLLGYFLAFILTTLYIGELKLL